METKVILTLNDEDAKMACRGLHLISCMASDTGYMLEQIINAAAERPIETELHYVGYISEAINEFLSEKRYLEELEKRRAERAVQEKKDNEREKMFHDKLLED